MCRAVSSGEDNCIGSFEQDLYLTHKFAGSVSLNVHRHDAHWMGSVQ